MNGKVGRRSLSTMCTSYKETQRDLSGYRGMKGCGCSAPIIFSSPSPKTSPGGRTPSRYLLYHEKYLEADKFPMLEDSRDQLICWHWDICPFVVDFDDPPHPKETVLLNVMLPPQRQAFPPTNSPGVNRRRGLRKVTR